MEYFGSNDKSSLQIAKEEITDPKFWRKVIYEFFGTFLLVFAGLLSVICSQNTSDDAQGKQIDSLVSPALTFGGVLAILVALIGPVSGCYLNPAVTISMLLIRRCSIVQLLFYLPAQLTGFVHFTLNPNQDRLFVKKENGEKWAFRHFEMFECFHKKNLNLFNCSQKIVFSMKYREFFCCKKHLLSINRINCGIWSSLLDWTRWLGWANKSGGNETGSRCQLGQRLGYRVCCNVFPDSSCDGSLKTRAR